jgi:hypothetical protein
MGTWGTGLYQSDIASDVRDVYRSCKKLGFADEDLVSVVLDTVGLSSVDSEDYAPAYLALADLLSKDGMLPDDVQETALDLIRGAKLPERFEDVASRRKHAAVLQELAKRLRSAPRRRTAARKAPYIERCDFAVGEVLACPLPRGGWALLRVVAYHTRFRGKSPICEALAWNIAAIPPAARIKRLRFLRQKNIPVLGELKKEEMLRGLIEHKRLPAGATWQDYVDQYTGPYIPIIRVSERDPHFHRVVRTSVSTPSERPFHSDWWVARNAWTTWKDLWMKLEGYFSDEISDPRLSRGSGR